jgi:hypothetical protein
MNIATGMLPSQTCSRKVAALLVCLPAEGVGGEGGG